MRPGAAEAWLEPGEEPALRNDPRARTDSEFWFSIGAVLPVNAGLW